jgi:hypothetical protein
LKFAGRSQKDPPSHSAILHRVLRRIPNPIDRAIAIAKVVESFDPQHRQAFEKKLAELEAAHRPRR